MLMPICPSVVEPISVSSLVMDPLSSSSVIGSGKTVPPCFQSFFKFFYRRFNVLNAQLLNILFIKYTNSTFTSPKMLYISLSPVFAFCRNVSVRLKARLGDV